MAKLVYGLSQSLDGCVDHQKMGRPRPALFRHFIEQVRGLTGMVYRCRVYEVMRYWDDDLPDWDTEEREFCGGVAESSEVGGVVLVESQLAKTPHLSRMTSNRWCVG